MDVSSNAIEIANTPREELARKIEERDRKYIEEGPAEMRECRIRQVQLRRNVSKAITHRLRTASYLQKLISDGAGREQIRQAELLAESAAASVEDLKAEILELQEVQTEFAEQAESERYSEDVQAKALSLIRQRRKSIQSIGENAAELPARWGSVGGSIFRTVRQLREAEEAGNETLASTLRQQLEDLKEQEAELSIQRDILEQQIKDVRLEFEAKLQMLA